MTDKKAVAGLLIWEQRVLTIQRSSKVVAPLKWCFPGGHVEPNESWEDALIREFHEELSLEITPGNSLAETVTSWNANVQWWRVFAKKPIDSLQIQADPAEVEDYRWLTFTELLKLGDALLESNLELVQRLQDGSLELGDCQD